MGAMPYLALFAVKKRPLDLITAFVGFCGLLTMEFWLSTRFDFLNACLQIKLFFLSGLITAVITFLVSAFIIDFLVLSRRGKD